MRSPRHIAMDFLARREHSREELIQKLTDREVCYEEACEVVDQLMHEGLQSDKRYAEMLIRSRMNKGQGPMKIEQALRTSGVDNEIYEHLLSQCQSRWGEQVKNAWIKKFGVVPQSAEEKAKQIRFLISRGFALSQINTMLKQQKEEVSYDDELC